jgi:hypothetical protein
MHSELDAKSCIEFITGSGDWKIFNWLWWSKKSIIEDEIARLRQKMKEALT